MKKIYLSASKEELKEYIRKYTHLYGSFCSLNHLDVSKIQDMSYLFCGSAFNGDISKWDVSSVKNMDSMFAHSQFRGNLELWKPLKLLSLQNMFTDDLNLFNLIPPKYETPAFNIPYWFIEDKKSRDEAIASYHEKRDLSIWLSTHLEQKKSSSKIKI